MVLWQAFIVVEQHRTSIEEPLDVAVEVQPHQRFLQLWEVPRGPIRSHTRERLVIHSMRPHARIDTQNAILQHARTQREPPYFVLYRFDPRARTATALALRLGIPQLMRHAWRRRRVLPCVLRAVD